MSVIPSSTDPWWQRLINRFGAYTTVGFTTFLIDLALIWIFINLLHIRESLAIGAAFLIAVHLNYAALRWWVYRKTHERNTRTYSYFVTLAIIVSFIIPTLVGWFEVWFDLEMFTARIIVAMILGLIGFSFNTLFNFRLL
jgi:putative flippase GtrA